MPNYKTTSCFQHQQPSGWGRRLSSSCAMRMMESPSARILCWTRLDDLWVGWCWVQGASNFFVDSYLYLAISWLESVILMDRLQKLGILHGQWMTIADWGAISNSICADRWRQFWHLAQSLFINVVSVGCGPLTLTVTTKIITFLIGNPYKPSFTTVTVRGPDPKYQYFIKHLARMWIIARTCAATLGFKGCYHVIRFIPVENKALGAEWSGHPMHHCTKLCGYFLQQANLAASHGLG